MIRKVLLPKSKECLQPCFGVERAFKKCLRLKDKADYIIYTKIAHNKILNNNLKKRGLVIIKELGKIKKRKAIIGAHGIQKKDLEFLKKKKISFLDLTCPYVKQFLKKAVEIEGKGYQIIIIGDKNHREIRNICSYLKKPIVVKNADKAKNLNHYNKAALFIQTTELQKNIDKVLPVIKKKCRKLVFNQTRCFTTEIRQNKALELAKKADLMLVITDKTSRNGKNLVKICTKITKTRLIQNSKEIKPEFFKGVKKVGIIASASTPSEVIDEIIEYLRKKI